jgi:hypothetical protein
MVKGEHITRRTMLRGLGAAIAFLGSISTGTLSDLG